ncbi:hypothetical protein Ocin01_11416 [Orchesella cincta]|uniref:Uncharacterized protein n=1 Tax=Orchesella cincta TaxID=48709 RepID=A0A1D2MQS3_ORCCI|nr:hypothetical protein Ocin01_11416 [Orchesella cincta]
MPKRCGSPTLSDLYGQRHKLGFSDVREQESIIVPDDDDDEEIVWMGNFPGQPSVSIFFSIDSRNLAEQPSVQQTEREEEVSSRNPDGLQNDNNVSRVEIQPGPSSFERRQDEGQKINEADIPSPLTEPSLTVPSWLTDSHNDQIFHFNRTISGERGQREPSEPQESSSRCSRPAAPKRRTSHFHVNANGSSSNLPPSSNDKETARQQHPNIHSRSRSPVRVRNNSTNSRTRSPEQHYTSTSSASGRRRSHDLREDGSRERLRNEDLDHSDRFHRGNQYRDNRHQRNGFHGPKSRNWSGGSSSHSRSSDPRRRRYSDHHSHHRSRSRSPGFSREKFNRGGHSNARGRRLSSESYGSDSHFPSNNFYRPQSNLNRKENYEAVQPHIYPKSPGQESQPLPTALGRRYSDGAQNSNNPMPIHSPYHPHHQQSDSRQHVNFGGNWPQPDLQRVLPTEPWRISCVNNTSTPVRSPHHPHQQQQCAIPQEFNYGQNQHQPNLPVRSPHHPHQQQQCAIPQEFNYGQNQHQPYLQRVPPTDLGRINSDAYLSFHNVSVATSPSHHPNNHQQSNTNREEVTNVARQHQPSDTQASTPTQSMNSGMNSNDQNVPSYNPPKQSASRLEVSEDLNQCTPQEPRAPPSSQSTTKSREVLANKRNLPTKHSVTKALQLMRTCNEIHCSQRGFTFRERKDAIEHLAKHDKELCFICFQAIKKTGPDHRIHVAKEHEDSKGESLCPIKGCHRRFSYGGMYIHQVKAHYQIEEGEKQEKSTATELKEKAEKIIKEIQSHVNINRKKSATEVTAQCKTYSTKNITDQSRQRLPPLPKVSKPTFSTNRETASTSHSTSSERRVSSPLPSENQTRKSSTEIRSNLASSGSKTSTSAHSTQQRQNCIPGGSSIDTVEQNLLNQPRGILGFRIPKKKT